MRNDLQNLVVLMAGSLDKWAPKDRVKAVARKIAREAPALADMDSKALEHLARAVVAETLKDDLKRKVNLEKIDLATERAQFLRTVGQRSGSKHTPKAYAAALGRLELFCARRGISALEVTPALADDWIGGLSAEGRAAATVRLDVAAASSFFTWLERRHEFIRNPFRGTRSRPSPRPRRTLVVPTEIEVQELEAAADAELRAAIVTMSRAGLRVGALPQLSIAGTRFTATTKGKSQTGIVTQEVRDAIEQAGLSLRSPFAAHTAAQLADRFRYLAGRLQAAGKLRTRYSVHDLRHYFAVRLYEGTRDIYRVSKALGHAAVGVTEHYLRGLALEPGS